eukprot:CAMPEP_0182420030 /NCGR_PEP_ID=MMETSP1167-20130531/4520_1 /TAXON_ID=2988 /ORGANISM="Mallomonas Sp, Strain CCMP3275" /LENGTH=227 /DNA_ID=CAMNT_0024595411 /DNA_START=24 /DNA_END=704 /DNA_ORIENTATION=-
MQLSAAIEETVMLRSHGVEVVIPRAPEEPELSEKEEEKKEEEEEDRETRRRPTREVTSIKDQKRKLREERERERNERIRDREETEIWLQSLVATSSGGQQPSWSKTVKVLKDAIREGKRVGLIGSLEGGVTYCTELVKQAYKALLEAETSLREEEREREMNRALAELFVRTEPLGRDRYCRRYWSFDGDERLWVECREREESERERERSEETIKEKEREREREKEKE